MLLTINIFYLEHRKDDKFSKSKNPIFRYIAFFTESFFDLLLDCRTAIKQVNLGILETKLLSLNYKLQYLEFIYCNS